MSDKGKDRVSWGRLKAFEALSAWSGKERRVQLRPKITAIADKSNKDSREKAFFWQLVLGVVRNMRLLDAVLKAFLKKGMPGPGNARQALRLGLYQLLFMDRVPVHAAVDQSVRMVNNKKGKALVNAVLRRISEAIVEGGEAADPCRQMILPGDRLLSTEMPFFPDPVKRKVAYLAVRYSYPDFLVKRWVKRWGLEQATQVLLAGNTNPILNFRVNPLRATPAEVEEMLRADGVENFRAGPRAGTILVDWNGNPANLRALKEGFVTVQDQAAMHAVEVMAPAPGMKVLDLCSAPGGKTTQAAEMMGDEGEVYAWDSDSRRLDRTAQAVERLGLKSVRILFDLKLEEVLALGPYDRVLTDVPCTSTGVMAKRPEARWKLKSADFGKLPQIQCRILEQATKAVSPGGFLVYSTCSLEPEEDEEVVAGLAGWRVSHQETILPEGKARDGSFVARLERE